MTILTASAVLVLAASCQHVVAPSVIAGIAMHESGGNTAAVHVNNNGTLDKGLMQINQANQTWLGLIDPFDPCQSIAAAARLLASYSRYNTGSPTAGIGYAQAVAASVSKVKGGDPISPIKAAPWPSIASIFARPDVGRALAPSPTQ